MMTWCYVEYTMSLESHNLRDGEMGVVLSMKCSLGKKIAGCPVVDPGGFGVGGGGGGGADLWVGARGH